MPKSLQKTSAMLAVELFRLIASGKPRDLAKAETRVHNLNATQQIVIRRALGQFELLLDKSVDEWEHVRDVLFPGQRPSEAETEAEAVELVAVSKTAPRSLVQVAAPLNIN